MRGTSDILMDKFENLSESEYIDIFKEVKLKLDDKNIVKRDWDRCVVIGDTHGYLSATTIPVEKAVSRDIPIVFLGDYVDRGPRQLENLLYITYLKVKNPDKVVLLRGNHEDKWINERYGFYNELRMKYSEELYGEIQSFYEKLPILAVIGERYLMVHGGIPEGITDITEIDRLSPEDDKYREVLWNDPDESIKYFEFNYNRGAYKLYGEHAVNDFLEQNDLKMIFRSHQCFPSGYKYFFNRKLLTVFTVPGYCGNTNGTYAMVSGDSVNLKEM